jgi:hypothetical protein
MNNQERSMIYHLSNNNSPKLSIGAEDFVLSVEKFEALRSALLKNARYRKKQGDAKWILINWQIKLPPIRARNEAKLWRNLMQMHMPNITTLHLGFVESPDTVMDTIQTFPANGFRKLRCLDLSNTGMTTKHVTKLFLHLHKFPELKELVMHNCAIGDDGAYLMMEYFLNRWHSVRINSIHIENNHGMSAFKPYELSRAMAKLNHPSYQALLIVSAARSHNKFWHAVPTQLVERLGNFLLYSKLNSNAGGK